MSAFDTALDYVSGEHNKIVRLRDQRAINQRERMAEGDIVLAMAAQLDIARLEGQLDGLATASTQLQMVRERIEEGDSR